jgi:hypothetical protein
MMRRRLGSALLLALGILGGCQLFEGEAEQRVRSVLKDPDSAKFKDVRTYRYTWLEKSRWMTCGSVNAKNSFGAMGGFRAFIVRDSGVTFVSTSDVEDLNATLCCLDFGRAARALGDPSVDPATSQSCGRVPEPRILL